MKIALLSRWYWEENRRHGREGGTTMQLAEAVTALGHEIVVLSQSPEVGTLVKSKVGALEAWLSPRDKRRNVFVGLRDKLAKSAYGHRKVYSDALDLRDFLAARGPFDVLWAQAESPDGLVFAIAAEQGMRLPPVAVQIQALRYRFEKGVPVFNQQRPLGLAFRQATCIVANSELIAESLFHYALPNHSAAQIAAKVRVVPPHLQHAFAKAAGLAAETTPIKNRVLFLGALNEGKGALTFMDAIPKGETHGRGGTFVVVGAYTEQNDVFTRQWEERKDHLRELGAEVVYLGAVDRGEVIRQILLASVVVLPSLFDAFSRALVEALALGRPVVTTDRVGAARLVEEHQCALVVAPNDPAALARAIDATLSPDAPYAQNAQRLSPQILRDFSVETTARKFVELLSGVAGAASP